MPVAVLHYVENKEPAEIALLLGRNAVSVRTSLWRTRSKLRRRLGLAAESPGVRPKEMT